MTYLPIIDKLLLLFNLLKESTFILIFISIFIISLFLRFINKISKKRLLLISVLSSFGTFLAVILSNYEVLSKTFDNFMTILFKNVYFPSIYVYLFIIITTYVIFIKTLLSKITPKYKKVLNYILVFIINLLLILNLSIIANNKIDIFDQTSLYTNINLVSMLELSTTIYILWLILNIIIYIINNITISLIEKKEKKNLSVKNINIVNNNKEEDRLLNTKDIVFGMKQEDTYTLNDEISLVESFEQEKIQNTIQNTNIEYNTNIENDYQEHIVNKDVVSINDINKVVEDKVITAPKFINNIELNNLSNNNNIIFDEYINNKEKSNNMLNNILNNTFPLETKKEEVKKVQDKYSLNDYKLFSKMLKETIIFNNRNTIRKNEPVNINMLFNHTAEEINLYQKMMNSFTN